ncbi:hypothetical protein Tco_0837082 [Tanacetum coccineum]
MTAFHASAARLLPPPASVVRFLIDMTAGGAEFPRDSLVNAIDGDMVLETLLNDNPTLIRNYPEEFLVLLGLSHMRYVPAAHSAFYDDDEVLNPFDVVCAEKKLAENEKPLLEQMINTAGESASNVEDVLIVSSSKNPSPVAVSKAGEFVPGVTFGPPKRLVAKVKKPGAPRKLWPQKSPLTILRPKSVMGESAVGSSQEAADDLCSSGVSSQQLVSKGSSKTSASQSSASTCSEPLITSRPRPRSEPMAHDIPGIVFDLVEDYVETPREDRFYASMSVDPSVAKDIYHPDWDLTNDFVMDKGPLCRSFIYYLATPGQFSCLLSLSHQDVCDRVNVAATRHITLFSEIRLRMEHAEQARDKIERRLARRYAELEKGTLSWSVSERKHLENLKVEAGKFHVLSASYAKKETDLSTFNAKFQDLLREKEQIELRNASLWVRYFLNKLKERDILGSRLGACISAPISDGMRQGLEAGFMHGKKGTDINSIPAYNPNAAEVYADALKALNDVPFPLLEKVEACVNQPFSHLEALLLLGVHKHVQDEAGTSSTPWIGMGTFPRIHVQEFFPKAK